MPASNVSSIRANAASTNGLAWHKRQVANMASRRASALARCTHFPSGDRVQVTLAETSCVGAPVRDAIWHTVQLGPLAVSSVAEVRKNPPWGERSHASALPSER